MSLSAYDIKCTNMAFSHQKALSKDDIIYYILSGSYSTLMPMSLNGISVDSIFNTISFFAEKNLNISIACKEIKVFIVHCNILSSFEEKNCEGFSIKIDDSYAVVITMLSDVIGVLIHELCHVLVDTAFTITDTCKTNKLECIVEAVEYLVIEDYLHNITDLKHIELLNINKKHNTNNMTKSLICNIIESKNLRKSVEVVLK